MITFTPAGLFLIAGVALLVDGNRGGLTVCCAAVVITMQAVTIRRAYATGYFRAVMSFLHSFRWEDGAVTYVGPPITGRDVHPADPPPDHHPPRHD